MARVGKIEAAGVEADVLEMARQGHGARQIAKALGARGLDVCHTSVARFLRQETADRQRSRRAATAAVAAKVAGKAGEHVDDNLAQLRDLLPPMLRMARDAARLVRLPKDGAVSPIGSIDDHSASRIAEGLREWWEPVAAKDQIRAAALSKDLLAYLVELAGANPRPTDSKDLDAIRKAIGEVFGYATPPSTTDPQEAPPTPEEHTPPVMH